jgi:diaminopimelate epimerase
VLLLTALVLALSAAPADTAAPVAIYVFAQPSATGFTDVNQQQRAQSVADLTRRLSKKKDVVVVADPAAAELQVEVLDRGLRTTGNSQTTGTAVFGVAIATTKAERLPAVLVALRVGDYLLEIEGRDKRAKYAAEAVADHVVKWVTENRAQIAQRRTGIQP